MSLTEKIKYLTLTYENKKRVFHTVEDADMQVSVWAHEWVDNMLVEIDCEINFVNGVTAQGDIVLRRDLVYHDNGFLRAITAMTDLVESVRDFPKLMGTPILPSVGKRTSESRALMENFENN